MRQERTTSFLCVGKAFFGRSPMPVALGLLTMLWVLLLTGCGSSKEATKGDGKRYQRTPLVETTEEALKREVMMIDAKMKQELGKEREAQRIYHAILQADPHCSAAAYELSRLMASNGMNDSAIYYARQAVAEGGDVVWYAIHLAGLYAATNQPALCVKSWEGIVKQHPDVLDYYYELSNACLRNNDAKGAIAALNRVEKRVGITEAVSMQKAKLWNAIGQEGKALEEIKALADAMPHESQYNSLLAESYMSNGEYDKAKQYYDRALEANPDDSYAHLSLAEYYKAKGQPRKAYEELKAGFQTSDLSTTNQLQLLTNFYSSEEFYGIHSRYAFELLDIIMKQSDDSTTYAAFYGDVLMRQKQYEAASRQFALALSKDSSKYEIWEALLVSELQGGVDSVRLQHDAERAAALFPLHPLPLYVQAVIAYDTKDYDKSIALATRCEQMGFDKGYLEAETYMLLAECFVRTKDSRCLEYYEKYLKLVPNDVNALNSYAYQLALAGKSLGAAEEISKSTLKAQPDNPYFLDTYAWILHVQGRDKEALPYIEKAIRLMKAPDEEMMQHYGAIKGK